MTQQERKAIEAYAKEIMKSGCVSNERDFVDGMLKGAKFALYKFRELSEEPNIFDIDCFGSAMIQIKVENNELAVTKAMNGGGQPVDLEKIIVSKI